MYDITWRQEIELQVSPPVAKSHFDHSARLGMEHHLIRTLHAHLNALLVLCLLRIWVIVAETNKLNHPSAFKFRCMRSLRRGRPDAVQSTNQRWLFPDCCTTRASLSHDWPVPLLVRCRSFSACPPFRGSGRQMPVPVATLGTLCMVLSRPQNKTYPTTTGKNSFAADKQLALKRLVRNETTPLAP